MNDYSVKCFGGATRMQSELTAAFNLVADKANWKNPVDALIDPAQREIVSDAVVHFTGSVPTFSPAGDKLRVKADGYYLTIGA